MEILEFNKWMHEDEIYSKVNERSSVTISSSKHDQTLRELEQNGTIEARLFMQKETIEIVGVDKLGHTYSETIDCLTLSSTCEYRLIRDDYNDGSKQKMKSLSLGESNPSRLSYQ